VREVGGLADTVTDISNEKEGTGITFHDFAYEEFEQAFHRSRKLFEDSKHMEKVIQRGMKKDFSWEKSAGEYVELYNKMI
jgi:starch synthase